MTDTDVERRQGTVPLAARPTPWLLLAAVTVVVVPLQTATRPLQDIDLYWHLLVGQEIIDGTAVGEAGRGWSFAPVPDTWVSTQWLSEVLFAWMHSGWGFTSFVVFRAVTTIIALGVLAAVTLHRRPPRAAVWPFALAGLALAMTAQDRSQQFTYLLAPLVGWWAVRLWHDGRLPRWWVVLPLVVLWSNLHGGWLILPMALGLAALARLVDQGLRDRRAWGALLFALLCPLAAAVAPSGFANAFAALRFSESTGAIGEWGKVEVWNWQSSALIGMTLLVVVAWARGRVRPSRGEIILALGLIAFGFQAWRSLTPAVLLLAPLVVGILARALGESDPVPTPVRHPMRRVLVTAAVVGAVLALGAAATQTPVVDPKIPVALLTRVADNPDPQRVLNTYNVAGPLLWFGGGPPHVTVGIDGRADRYGGAYIDSYTDGLVNARPGWEAQLDELAPTAAVLRVDEALAGVLVAQRDWVEVTREGRTVLLRAPGSTGWTP